MNTVTRSALVIFLTVALFGGTAAASEVVHDAAREGDLAAVKRILNSEPESLDSLDRFRLTPLDWAATRAHWEVVCFLIEMGASVGNVGWDGGTVLHRACHYDAPQIARLLLEKGADPGHQNQWGRSPLHVAARRDCRQVAAALIASDVDLHAVTHEGWSPLHVASMSGHVEMMELLVSAGADEARKDGQGKTPREYFKPRPREVAMAPVAFNQYLGQYLGEDDFHVEVWERQGRIYITDFGFDEMYPIGEDEFYCRHEPWGIQFFRDADGHVVEMELKFLRRSHRLKKSGGTTFVSFVSEWRGPTIPSWGP